MPASASAELEKLDEALIVKALKSNNYSTLDIGKLNKIVKSLNKDVP